MLSGIGKRIRKLRLDKGQKLTELAHLAGVSKGLLSKIENGRTVPSVPVLLSIIQSLEIQPKDFFTDMSFQPPQRYIHKSAADLQPMIKEEEAIGFNYQFILNQALSNYTIEAVTLEIAPGAKRELVSVDAYEFKYVLEGHINYQIEEEFIHLSPGDSLLYDGRLMHVPHNDTDRPAKMLVIYFYDNN